jgi:YesN/AraC family two-component response regulator
MPDVLLLDIHLPNKDGLTLVKEILEQDKDGYIVMLSADSVSENVEASVKNGAKGFLTKPVSHKHLMDYFKRCPTVRFTDV